jgi:hypothetical protein
MKAPVACIVEFAYRSTRSQWTPAARADCGEQAPRPRSGAAWSRTAAARTSVRCRPDGDKSASAIAPSASTLRRRALPVLIVSSTVPNQPTCRPTSSQNRRSYSPNPEIVPHRPSPTMSATLFSVL